VPDEATFGFTWSFLDEMSWWALGIATAVAIGGAFYTRQVSFAVGCLVSVVIDVLLVRVSSRRARIGLEHGRIDTAAPLVMVGGRLLVKAGLLVLALSIPRVMSFAGTVVGVLAYDVTLSFVGSIVAATRVWRAGGRKGVAG
jgi:hypothetical protein